VCQLFGMERERLIPCRSLNVIRRILLFGDMSKYVIRRVRQLDVLRLEERFIDQGLIAFLGFALLRRLSRYRTSRARLQDSTF
jgi:hypothetical protein